MTEPVMITPVTICNLRLAYKPTLFRGPFLGNEEKFKVKLDSLISAGTIEVLSYNINNGEIFVFADIRTDEWINIIFEHANGDET